MGNWHREHKRRLSSLFLFVGIIISHLVAIIVVLNFQLQRPQKIHEAPLIYINLPAQKPPELEILPPDISPSLTPVPVTIAPQSLVIESVEEPVSDASLDGSDAGTTIFDPRLRERLNQGYKPKKAQGLQLDEHWVGSDGRTYIYMGNGECMVSMAKLDSRERGTSWSSNRVSCAKNDSEKMMDRVMADFESRKAGPD